MAASRSGKPVEYIAWSILLLTVLVSLRPLTPILWNDSPAFIESALLTRAAEHPVVVGGRDVGYPLVLALALEWAQPLRQVVAVQCVAWLGTIVVVVMATRQMTQSSLAIVFGIALALHPALAMFRNLILAESLYAFTLACTACTGALALDTTSRGRGALLVLCVLGAAAAACLKSIGLPVFVVACGTALLIAVRGSFRLRALALACIVLGSLGVAANWQVRNSSSHLWTQVLGNKTLLCTHLDVVLADPQTRERLSAEVGSAANAVHAMLVRDLASKKQEWPVLGFYADACTFDHDLDTLVAASNPNGPLGVGGVYIRLVLAAIPSGAFQLMEKVSRQLAVALWNSWPATGLDQSVSHSEFGFDATVTLLEGNQPNVPRVSATRESIRGAPLSSFRGASVVLLRGLSLLTCLAVVALPLFVSLRRRLDWKLLMQFCYLWLVWLASIVVVAFTHTFDVARYLVPTVPIGVCLTVVGLVLVRQVMTTQRADDGKSPQANR